MCRRLINVACTTFGTTRGRAFHRFEASSDPRKYLVQLVFNMNVALLLKASCWASKNDDP